MCMLRFDLCSAAEFSARRNRIDTEARGHIIRRLSYILVLRDSQDVIACVADPTFDMRLDDVLVVGMCKTGCTEGCSAGWLTLSSWLEEPFIFHVADAAASRRLVSRLGFITESPDHNQAALNTPAVLADGKWEVVGELCQKQLALPAWATDRAMGCWQRWNIEPPPGLRAFRAEMDGAALRRGLAMQEVDGNNDAEDCEVGGVRLQVAQHKRRKSKKGAGHVGHAQAEGSSATDLPSAAVHADAQMVSAPPDPSSPRGVQSFAGAPSLQAGGGEQRRRVRSRIS
jgi:hypothetical protein